MILASLTLIISTALFFFFFQSTCQRIVRREFDQPYFKPVIEAGQLEFPALSRSLEADGEQLDYARIRTALKCDFAAVTYLLKRSAAGSLADSSRERLLLLYSRLLFLSLAIRRALGLREKPAVRELAAIFQYFANVVGQRVQVVSFRDLASSSVA